MAVCLLPDLIDRYVAGNCSDREQEVVKSHVAQCTDCRKRLQSAQSGWAARGQPGLADRHQSNADGVGRTILRHEDEPDRRPTAGSPNSDETQVSGIPKYLTFEGYQIVKELPRGGQAIVYEAIQKATKMKVALKVLLPGLHGSARARRHFEQEVELAASLHHPNIVAIHDSGITQGQYYFSMEYIHGQPLDQYANSHPLTLRDKLALFSKVCDAMTHAHQRGVIHRDLKPSNILVDERGEPHILDFGLAKAAVSLRGRSESTVMPTVTGQIKGTVDYMSPEQAAGRVDLIDVRSDVYSLGVILYQMLTGRFPYDISGSAFEVLHRIQHEEPVRPRQIISRFYSDVEAILLKALAKEPARRYQSAAELRHDIQCFLQGLPIVAKSVSSLYLFRKIVARHRYASTVVALLLAIVFGFCLVYYHLYTQLRDKESELQNSHRLISNQTKEFTTLAQQAVLISHFLPAWHDGDVKRARLIGQYFSRGTRQADATHFLLDPRPLNEKIPKFREGLGGANTSLADFVIAEHYLRDGNRTEAAKAYEQCLSHARGLPADTWLIDKAQSRLFDLSSKTTRGETASVVRD